MPESDLFPMPPAIPRNVKMSPAIANLASAVVSFQKELVNPVKEKANPFFKSKYTDLASMWDGIREPLAANGLAILQFPRGVEAGIEVETVLVHASGEWMSDALFLPAVKLDPQGFGSAITYARRYALQAILGVCPEDDDGNAATRAVEKAREKLYAGLEKAARGGIAKLEAEWLLLSTEDKKIIAPDMPMLKAIGKKSAPKEGAKA